MVRKVSYPGRRISAAIITEQGATDPRAKMIAETLGRTGVIRFATPLATTEEPEDLLAALRSARTHPELIPELILICVGDGAGPASAVTEAITADLEVPRQPVRELFDHLRREDRPSGPPSVWRDQQAHHDASLPAGAVPIFGTNHAFAYRIGEPQGPVIVALPSETRALRFLLHRVLDALVDSGLFHGSLRTLWTPDTDVTRARLVRVAEATRVGTDWPLLPTDTTPDWGGAMNRLDVVVRGDDNDNALRWLMTATLGTHLLDVSPPAFLGRMWSGGTVAVVDADMTGGDLATHLEASGRLQEVQSVRARAADFAADTVQGLADIAAAPAVDWTIAMLRRETERMDVAIVGRELRWSETGMFVPAMDPYSRNAYVIACVVRKIVSMLSPHMD